MGRRRQVTRCGTPLKDRYRYEPEAQHAADEAGKVYGWPMDPYLCRCGVWHITRRKPKPRQSTR